VQIVDNVSPKWEYRNWIRVSAKAIFRTCLGHITLTLILRARFWRYCRPPLWTFLGIQHWVITPSSVSQRRFILPAWKKCQS
jgi:hypothetical protein